MYGVIMMGVVIAVVALVTLGYLALWSAYHENTSKWVSGFGKVMAIILFVFAALIVIMGVTAGHWRCPYCHMGMGPASCTGMATGDKWMRGRPMTGMMEGPMAMGEGKEAITKDRIATHLKKMKSEYPEQFEQGMAEFNKAEKPK